MEELIEYSILGLIVAVFCWAEYRQWGVPEHMKHLPLTDFKDES